MENQTTHTASSIHPGAAHALYRISSGSQFRKLSVSSETHADNTHEPESPEKNNVNIVVNKHAALSRSVSDHDKALTKIPNRLKQLNKTQRLKRAPQGKDAPVSDNKKSGNTSLSPVFEGSLDRAAMAEVLKIVMQEKKLSVRKTASAVNTSTNDIQRISKGTATLDKAVEVLGNLGYELHFEVRQLDKS